VRVRHGGALRLSFRRDGSDGGIFGSDPCANLVRLQEGTRPSSSSEGAIVGAGIAREAAQARTPYWPSGARRLRERDEREDVRLIHGGLRYSETTGFGSSVWRSANEIASWTTRPPGPSAPVRDPSLLGSKAAGSDPGFGLFLYACCPHASSTSGLAPSAGRIEREPGLGGRTWQGAGLYFDAWTNDARFVLAVVQDAGRAGAAVANYVEVTELIREGSAVVGCPDH